LSDLLPRDEQWECFSILADARDLAKDRTKAGELRRQALDSAQETFARLQALPGPGLDTPPRPDYVPIYEPGAPPEALALSAASDHNGRFSRIPWLDWSERPPETRERVLADLGRRIASLQAQLGQFEAAMATAEKVPPRSFQNSRRPHPTLRRAAQSDVVYWMARKGQSRAALDRALKILDRESQLDALVAVAQACGERLAERAK
jgi:hypothetical protein